MSGEGQRGVTRRAALVSIGHAAAGLSITSGLNVKASTAILLPGVYLPSGDHLSHALMASERFHPIPPGCPTDYIQPLIAPFSAAFFSDAEFQVLMRITELMLGVEPALEGTAEEVARWIDLRVAGAKRTREAARNLDPLCRAVAVAYFGSAQVTQLESAIPEQTCREGFDWLATAANTQGAKNFVSLTAEQQSAILDSISDARKDNTIENAGTRFFAFAKSEVIRGYYTSQAGLKELNFKGNSFYARSPGCDRMISSS